jgi:hypothetical protein
MAKRKTGYNKWLAGQQCVIIARVVAGSSTVPPDVWSLILNAASLASS